MPLRQPLLIFCLILALLFGVPPLVLSGQSSEDAPAPPTAPAAAADPLTESGRWEWQSPAISDVFALDEKNVYATGQGFWRSSDGGDSWVRTPIFESTRFTAVRFRDASHGYLLGELPLVLTTSDGGKTWVRSSGRTGAEPGGAGDATSGTTVWHSLDSYAIGTYGPDYTGTVLKYSTDGGTTWSESAWVAPITAIFGYNQSAWVYYGPDNPDTGCMAGVSSTQDGGKTWNCGFFWYENKVVWILDVGFASANDGWLAGQYKLSQEFALWRSTNGGQTWQQQRTYGERVSWVVALDGQTAWVGLGSHMERTTDGGLHWENLPLPPGRPSFTSISRGWSYDANHIYRTSDGGNNWTPVFTQAPRPNAGWFLDHLTGWRAVGNRMERTTDGGDSWLSATLDLESIDGFQFVDGRSGWAWNNAANALRHTTDGGATWSSQEAGTDTFEHLQFIDAFRGWVSTSDFAVRRTVDGGQTWKYAGSPPVPGYSGSGPVGTADLGDLRFLNPYDGIALVSYCWYDAGTQCTGGQSRTSDGGATWGAIEPGPKDNVFVPDGENGWGWTRLGEPDGLHYDLKHTSDAAANWTGVRNYVTWFGPNWLAPADGRQAWNGSDDTFYFTADSGASWKPQRAEARPQPTAPSVDRLGHAATGNGLFYRATEIGAIRAQKPPVVDGWLDDWAGVPAYSFKAGDVVGIEGSAPAVLAGSLVLRAAWDKTNLYFALQVYDDAIEVDSPGKPWQDDSVELGLDGGHDHVRRWDLGADQDDRQFTIDANGARYESGAAFEGYRAGRQAWEKGYVLEVAIPRSLLGPSGLSVDRLIGFNLGLQDDDDGGLWESRLTWLDKDTYKANAAWGQIRLLSEVAPFEGAGTATPTPTETASPTPTHTGSPVPTATASPTPTSTPTGSLTPTATATPSTTRPPSGSAIWLPLITQ